MNAKTKKCYVLLFVLFFTTYGYFFQGGGWNQNIRICQIRAMLHQHTFIIDAYKEDSHNPPFEFVNTGDWSYKDGHYYSNKSPGLSFLAVVPFGVTEYVLKHLFPSDVERQVHLSAYLSTLSITSLSSTLLCLLLFFSCNHFFGVSRKNSLIVTVFFGFGTLVFSYSTIFYAHMPAAFFSFLSFVLALSIKHDDPQKKRGRALLSGFSSATAVLVEPSTVLILGCIMAYLMSFKEGRRCIPFYLLGCIPPGVLQGFYNTVCFGGPLASSYEYANEAVMFEVEGGLFGFPHPKNIIKILFLPNRGLFASSPVFLMALPGIVLFLKERKWRPEAVFCASVSLLFILFIVSYYAWHHASTPGPRYLLPAFPFFFLAAVWALTPFPKTFKIVGVLSILINLTITLVGNEIPHDIENPLTDFILKDIVAGRVSVNPVPFSNFANYPIDALADREKWTPNFNAFNLGEIIFPHSPASVLPLIGFWMIWWFIVWKRFLEQD
jgi:hypothetical protein